MHRHQIDQCRVKPTDSSLWKQLVKLWPHLESMTYWELGNGKDTRLWEDALTEPGLKLSYKLRSQNYWRYGGYCKGLELAIDVGLC